MFFSFQGQIFELYNWTYNSFSTLSFIFLIFRVLDNSSVKLIKGLFDHNRTQFLKKPKVNDVTPPRPHRDLQAPGLKSRFRCLERRFMQAFDKNN